MNEQRLPAYAWVNMRGEWVQYVVNAGKATGTRPATMEEIMESRLHAVQVECEARPPWYPRTDIVMKSATPLRDRIRAVAHERGELALRRDLLASGNPDDYYPKLYSRNGLQWYGGLR